ncbi:hypothetical protein ASG35_14315 [Burkholderia sp. Leaf177]|nr:hypothetical protein ASG35_14315 [Burkholderia sp. Leaf177]
MLFILNIDSEQDFIMAQTEREKNSGKPLGDSGSGASGGGSIGNLPGPGGAATGGDAHQGVRTPDAPLREHDGRTDKPAEEVDEVKRRTTPVEGNGYRKSETEGATSSVGDSANSPRLQTSTEAALPSTIDKNPRPKE